MPAAEMNDELEAQARELLDLILSRASLKLEYQLSPAPGDETARVVNITGADARLLLEQHEELLHAIEYLTRECLRLTGEAAHALAFDCLGRRQLRADELATSARIAAEKVRRTGIGFEFSPMPARDRRTIHLALRDCPGVHSESEGEARDRHVVIHPENPARPATRQRRESRRL